MPTLNWIGKEKVINHHLDVPYRILQKQYTYDGNSEEDKIVSDNKIIHGDNLEVLKSLLPEYEGIVDFIYIDPPYNTGNENWVYNDNVNHPKIKKWLGTTVGKENDDLTRHDKWLCMIYPRLKLLQRLLNSQGVIFISIGEDELANLKLVCDEIFGLNNRIGLVSRIMKSGGNKGNFFSPNVDYILVYAKDKSKANDFKTSLDEKLVKKLYNQVEKQGNRLGEYYRAFGLYQSSLDSRPNQRYYIECPDGTLVIPPGETHPTEKIDGAQVLPKQTDGCWRWSADRYKFERLNGNIVFKKSKNDVLIDSEGSPAKWNIYTKIWLKDREDEGQTPTNLISEYENRHSSKELSNLGIQFDYAKSKELIKYLIKIAIKNKNAIILDSFGGSGTTAHAVLELNKEDDGDRKFILVEMEDYANSITAERVKRVVKGYADGKKIIEGTGGCFTYYELGDSLFIDENLLNENLPISKILEYVWYTETKTKYIKQDEKYFLGCFSNTAYYFFYDKNYITTLDDTFLRKIRVKAEQYIIYADNCLLAESLMRKYQIVFKKIPRDITRF